MKKFNKNTLLIFLVFLNQSHVIFKGSGVYLTWLINDITKSLNFSVFLFVKHLSMFVLLFLALKPKGVNKNLLLFLLIISFLDLFFFIINANHNISIIKFGLSSLLFCFLKSKFNKWIKY